MGEKKVMADVNGDKQLTCKNRTADDVIAAAATALSDFKNPFNTSEKAIRAEDQSHDTNADRGYVNLVATTSKVVTVTTCYDDVTDDDETACTCGS